MSKINFNGTVSSKDQFNLSLNNRAFKYGDSLFETIRVFEGKMPFLKLHFNRLISGVNILGMNISDSFNFTFFENEIQKLIFKKENCRIRFTLFRNDGGLYTPKSNDIQFLIEKTPLSSSQFELNEEGLDLGITKEKLLSPSHFSHLKTGNSLPYILAGIEKDKNRYDDILILNDEGEIAEAISSNVFVLVRNRVYTPPLNSGCVGGTIRTYLLETFDGRIKEKSITLDLLEKADAVFLTNAIHGIRWVKSIKNINYLKHKMIDFYIQHLNPK